MGPFLESDRRIAALAARQDGVVRHAQLRELGLTQKAIQQRRDVGWLIDLHWQVYAVGHDRLSPAGRRLAAVWAYGPKAALKQADVLGLFDLRALEEVVAAHPRHRGRRTLVALLEAARTRELSLTLSELEDRFCALCDAHVLPRPAVNARPLGFRVDFLWTDARLVAETDGWRFHRTRAAFEEDRARDQALTAAGFRVVRFTHHQLTTRPDDVAATLTALLGATAGRAR